MVADISNNLKFFLYDVKEITLSEVADYAEVRISLATAGEILTETFYPDEAGTVTLRDLPSLLRPYFALPGLDSVADTVRCNPLQVTLRAADSNGPLTLYLDACYSRMPLDMLVPGGYILSRYKEVLTAEGREEFFPFAAGSGMELQIGVAYLDGGAARYVRKQVSTAGMAGFMACRVSAQRVASLAGVQADAVLYYLVTLTNAEGVADRVKYVVDRRARRRQTTFLYLNNFGVPETITLLGLETEEPELEGDTVRMLDRERRINPDLVQGRTVNSGYMQTDKYESLKDMLTSPDIRLLEDGRNIPVVITDIDFSHQHIGNERISVSLSFRPAVSPYGKFSRTNPLKGRIFDQTFDYTFD